MSLASHDIPELPASRALALADCMWLSERLRAAALPTSEMTFTNLFVWAGTHPVMLARIGETLLFWRGSRERGYLLAPVGTPLDRDGVARAFEWSAALGGAPRFARLPEASAKALVEADPSLAMREERDHADYVYRREDLALLAGRKYDGKRNLIKKFQKSVAAEFAPLNDALVERCRQMQTEWCETRQCSEHPDLDAEDDAVRRALEYWAHLPLLGGALLVGEERRVAGFIIAERLTADTAVMHFEKGTTLYPGVYQAVSQAFCERMLGAFEYVNREQDLGVEGLRKAKLSYHPHHFVPKFTVGKK
jgi:hypothetical protein